MHDAYNHIHSAWMVLVLYVYIMLIMHNFVVCWYIRGNISYILPMNINMHTHTYRGAEAPRISIDLDQFFERCPISAPITSLRFAGQIKGEVNIHTYIYAVYTYEPWRLR